MSDSVTESQSVLSWRVQEKQKRNRSMTEIVKMPGRWHSLTIDAGWREVTEKALDFVKRVTTITTAKTA